MYSHLFSSQLLTHGSSDAIQALPIEDWIIYSCFSVFIVLFAGMMSGLTVGMMSLDELDLEIKLYSGTDIEKSQAKKVIPVINQHHFLLVTLLVANAAAMETLPLLLDNMFNPYIAIVMSVTFVLAFGEVIPQAFCTGPNQLAIASRLVPIVKIVMFIFFPVSYPIAKLLDCILGHEHGKKFKNDDLKALVSLHEVGETKPGSETASGLGVGQVKIIHGAIDLQKAIVRDHMISIDNVYMLRSDSVVSRELLQEILKMGYSRVPIYQGESQDNIIGILHVKKLVAVKDGTPLESPRIKLRKPVFVHPNISILDLLGTFQEGKGHMALVTEHQDGNTMGKSQILGIITLEDVMELLLKTDIDDEDDYDRRVRKQAPEGRMSKVSILKPMGSRLSSNSYDKVQVNK